MNLKKRSPMKIRYNKQVDAIYIAFSDIAIAESEGDERGIIIDYDREGEVVGIEILQVTKKGLEPSKIEYEFVE